MYDLQYIDILNGGKSVQLAMSIAVMLICLGIIGIGYSLVHWSNNRKGL